MRGVLAIVLLAAATFAADWRVINNNVLTTDLGIAFLNEFVGYTAGDANGVGPAILKTTNGALSFEKCNATFGPDVLLLDLDAAGESIVVSSVFGELYSANGGKYFQRSTGGGTSQSVRYLGVNGDGGHKYGTTGQFGKKQGVAISTNSGRTFKSYDAKLSTRARYGAFPTDTTWYVAAGEWPDNGQATTGTARHFRQRRSEYLNNDGTLNLNTPATPRANEAGYVAQITKTTDGGNTWSTVFFENNTFYFNAIDCAPGDVNNCCAVGESDGTDAAGGRIHCTTDGGKTWNRTFWSPNTDKVHYSLLELRYSSATDIWAVGGQLTQIEPSAWFVHSVDGGKTWQPDSTLLKGYYALGVTMVSPTVGYAAVDNLVTQIAGIAKYH